MGASERRSEIIRILCRRRHETIANLAEEFGVSTRTILRDIEVLSATEPIYTLCGRYGGVFVTDNFVMSKMYMTEAELSVLKKLALFADNRSTCILSTNENRILENIISQYTKPDARKGKNYELTRKRAV